MKTRRRKLLRPLLLAALAVLLLAGPPGGAPAVAGTTTATYLPLIYQTYPVGDLTVSRVEVVQGITMSDSYTVQVAHRPALLRVFVNLVGPSSVAGVLARLTRYVGGNPQDSLMSGPTTIQAATNEGNLAHTLNFSLPDGWLASGTSYVIELDPLNALAESNESNNRFPGGGQQSFNFVNVPTLEVVIVPVRYARPGAPVSEPETGDLSYLTWMPFKVFPVSQINYTVRGSVYTFNGDLRYSSNGGQGWSDLLYAITSIHNAEDPGYDKLYYGLVDSIIVDGCSGGCIAGIGWIGSKTSAGFAGFISNRNEASPTFTHEMGHNFGRQHSPCGVAGGPYPYPGGAPIGQWGYDPASGLLYSPNTYKDYMSYCSPEWTSDYTYFAIANAMSTSQVAGAVKLSEALVFSGQIGDDGVPQVNAAFIESVPTAQLAATSGPYQLEVLDAQGHVLASQAFTPLSIAVDQQSGLPNAPNLTADFLGFRVAVPVVAGAVGLRVTQDAAVVWERQVGGPAPDLAAAALTDEGEGALAWSVSGAHLGLSYRLSFSPDGGKTWTLLEPAAATPNITVPAELLAGAVHPLVEVQASDGLRVTRETYEVTDDGATP